MEKTSPRDFFEKRHLEAKNEEIIAQKRFETMAIARLIVFAAAIACVWFWDKSQNIPYGAGLFILTVAFLFLMKRQQSARRERDFQRNLQTINQDELGRLEYRFERPENGQHHQEREHHYASDLDIFGDYSLFRLLNRTRTAEGSRRFASWLKNHASFDEILLRQEASQKFAQDAEFRQAWEATALLHKHAAQQVGAFRSWAQETLDADLANGLKWRWWSVVTIIVICLAIAHIIPVWPIFLSLGWHLVILRRYQEAIQSITNRTTALGQTLLAYSELLNLAERSSLPSRWWDARKHQIQGAAKELEQVGKAFDRLDYRNNVFFGFFVGIPTFWDLHCLASLEAWKQKHGAESGAWLSVLSDIEAMNSIAGFAFANPAYVMPQVTWEKAVRIEATQLGHPLISPAKRISNNFQMAGLGHTVLVTGSNMSGKSTFLRTLGLNLVLAQIGAVVAATQFSCSPLRVFSSMRTQDSLEESTSSFYAELKRLRLLLERSLETSAAPVFYLLDEILKGTNSADRHRGAEALIRQLHGRNAAGLVSTHDLELGEWGATETYVDNFHFRSDVEDGKLHFDYKLHEGICRSFNASELMRMMGIDIKNSDDQASV